MTDFITQVVQPPFTVVEAEIVRDEDWTTPLPQIVDIDGPVNLTGKTIDIYVRPTYGHATLIKKLSTVTGEITVTSAVNGETQVNMWRVDVIATFPVGRWVWFCTLFDGANYFELWRGDFIVHAGNISS